MVKNFEEFQQASKENIDLAMKSVSNVSKSAQAIAAELADYSKKSFEESTALMEKLFGAKSFEKAIEVQTEYAKRTSSAKCIRLSPRKPTSRSKA